MPGALKRHGAKHGQMILRGDLGGDFHHVYIQKCLNIEQLSTGIYTLAYHFLEMTAALLLGHIAVGLQYCGERTHCQPQSDIGALESLFCDIDRGSDDITRII